MIPQMADAVLDTLLSEALARRRKLLALRGIWEGMRSRCLNDPRYTSRGITFDYRWQSFRNFYRDMVKGYSSGMNLDRIDNDGPYSKGNCQWLSRSDHGKKTAVDRSKRLAVELLARL
jgi:hypothetical protein